MPNVKLNSKTILNITTSVGVCAIVEVDTGFQDITIKIPLIDLDDGFAATGATFRRKLNEHFLTSDHLEIFNMVYAVANDEMKYNLIMR